MMGVIGIVMLVGIAVNNSIILVDRINQLKQSGMELTDAIVESGQQRIRPILMTTLTTILALLPMTFGFGECFTSFTYGDRSDRWVGDFDRHESDGNPVCILCI